MKVDWLLFQSQPTVYFVSTIPSVIALFAFWVVSVATVAVSLLQLQQLTRQDIQRWALLLLTSGFSASLFGLTLPTLNTTQPITLLGFFPIFILAIRFGRIPAMSAGFLSGFIWMLFGTSRVTASFEMLLFAAVMGLFLHQRYLGRLATFLRDPAFAGLLSIVFVLWPLNLLGLLTTNAAGITNSVEQVLTEALSLLAANLFMGVITVCCLAVIRALRPEWLKPRNPALIAPPWQTRLRQRVLLVLLPLTVGAIFLLVGTVSLTSYAVATQLVVNQMERDARNAANSIPFFIEIGQGLIRDLAAEETFQRQASPQRTAELNAGLRSVPFFEQLILLDAELNILEDTATSDFPLTDAELERAELAIVSNIPGEVIVFNNTENTAATVSFIAPITDEAERVIVGRATLDDNPMLAPVARALALGSFEASEGFLINEQGTILFHPSRPDLNQDIFSREDLLLLDIPRSSGQTFRQRLADGSTQLLYILPITGRSDWFVVISVPNIVVINLAAQIAVPTLLLMIALTALGLTVAILGVQRVTEPIEQLSTAVGEISAGNLDTVVTVAGNDEIGRLGIGFDEMRLRLKGRIMELERLLRVTQGVSSSLELFRVVPPILGSAIDVTSALTARIALRQDDVQIQRYTSGKSTPEIAALDAPLIDLVERQGIIVISQLQRATGTLDQEIVPEELAALLAFPLRSERAFLGVMWVGYRETQIFEEEEISFLRTLAGQAAASASNALLFSEAQEGRAQLQTVLDSTADGMIVTDQDGHILLFNPAAETYLGIDATSAQGAPAAEVIEQKELVKLLTNLQEPVAELEIPGANSSVILVNTSTIITEGSISGRVAVLRDITAIKELDSIKTVFLRMVSHDLRSPLTFMRGYISILPMMGQLNDKQMEALAKIDAGIDYISEMTQRLTHLSRLTFGEEAELEYALIDVEEIIHDIISQLSNITSDTDATIQVHSQPNIPLFYADYMLYRQAIFNLVNNAIKYGGEGCHIDIHIEVADDFVSVSVTDDGIGIREDDQARLFEAFYRVPQREGEVIRPEGTGLGLALVRAITEAHGGQLNVQSTYGEGSTFSISFPIRTTAQVSA